MTSKADYDNFEKIFKGTWRYDRVENLDAMLKAYEPTEKQKIMMTSLKPDVSFSRQDSKVTMSYKDGDMKFDLSFALGQEVEFNADPDMMSKTTTVMKGNSLYQDLVALPSNKRSSNTWSVSGDELMSAGEYNGVAATAYYKKV